MELKIAKEVLEENGIVDIRFVIIGYSYCFTATGYVHKFKQNASLVTVTADEHEAIATWMRDPEGVVGS